MNGELLCSLVGERVVNLYVAGYSAQSLEMAEEIFNENPTQELGEGRILDFMVEVATPPYGSMKEIADDYPDVYYYLVRMEGGPGALLILVLPGDMYMVVDRSGVESPFK